MKKRREAGRTSPWDPATATNSRRARAGPIAFRLATRIAAATRTRSSPSMRQRGVMQRDTEDFPQGTSAQVMNITKDGYVPPLIRPSVHLLPQGEGSHNYIPLPPGAYALT